MTTELAAITDSGYSREKIDLIKEMVAKDCNDTELQLFLYTCKKTGLDPLARQIYAIKRGGKMTIQTGIDGYRVIADRTGKLAGISDPIFDQEYPEHKYPNKASVTVKKVVGDNIAEFTATARWMEYNAGGPMWTKMAFLMLGKCAEALALRKAFPADLSGVYTAEEMQQADNDQQRDAVYAEVERQKAAYVPSAKSETLDMQNWKPESIGIANLLPPELDWSYNEGSGLLICRPLNAVLRNKKQGGGKYLTLKLNGTVETSDLATYFHATHQEALLNARDKVCKLIVSLSKDGKFVNIDEVLEIDGQKVEAKDDSEFQARALASILDIGDSDLMKQHREWNDGLWPLTLDWLQRMKAEMDAKSEA